MKKKMGKQNDNKGKGGKGKVERILTLSPSLSALVEGRIMETPVPYNGTIPNVSLTEATFNGKQYKATVDGLTEDGNLITTGQTFSVHAVTINGVDDLLYANKQGIFNLSGSINIGYDYSGTDHIWVDFGVVDWDNSGTDDLIIAYNSYNAYYGREVAVVYNFTNQEIINSSSLNIEIKGFINNSEGYPDIIVKDGTPFCEGEDKSLYGLAKNVFGNYPPKHGDILQSLTVQNPVTNPDRLIWEGTHPCIKYYVTLLDSNKNLTPFGFFWATGQEGFFLSYPLTPGETYYLRFVHFDVDIAVQI